VTPSDVGEPREDKDNGHIPSAVTGCLQFGEDATSMTRRLGAEAPKKKLVYQKKKDTFQCGLGSPVISTSRIFPA
jgi:hypothetical protein